MNPEERARLRVGLIVLYVPTRESTAHARVMPGIVTRIYNDEFGTVALTIFTDGYPTGSLNAGDVQYSKAKEPRTWHFMEDD